ncbi:hypothetical protein [Desulfosporosinus nitroreducens]|uniref:hypothetical protein n=1 Tax=Desulfosporosinus nitroreducens TaxID=2018668 RepID=UPI00207D0BC2|nr:hypothetical protein [Desulfosporosinus nitroreducens]MCO1599767.1 hypothetical protein [Desulfosporosinus nitroreducens]
MQDSSVITGDLNEQLQSDDEQLEHLKREYLQWLEIAKEAMLVVGVGFEEAAEKMCEAFVSTFIIKYEETDEEPIGILAASLDMKQLSVAEKLDNSFHERWNKHWHTSRNNFRKLHNTPLKRRPRCRWRPRESRRQLDGLSPGIVVIDEYAFAEG